MSGEVVPIGSPSRAELWRRLRLAESIVSHRSIKPESLRQELLRVLRGEPGSVPKEAG